jgi:hypothetical protein
MNSRKQIKQVGDTVGGGQVINRNQYVLNKLNKLLFLLVLKVCKRGARNGVRTRKISFLAYSTFFLIIL